MNTQTQTLIMQLVRNPTSYSKLKGFETCPRQHYELEIAKSTIREPSQQLEEGEKVHAALAAALQSFEPIAVEEYARYQHWVDRIQAVKGKRFVECKWGLTDNLKPCSFFSPAVWLRIVVDAAVVNGPVGIAIDWKTGRSENVKDDTQLILTALVMFANFQSLQRVRCDYIWLAENRKTTLVLDRNEADDKWDELLPRFEKLDRAIAENDWPAKPNYLCKRWCPVKSCPHNGR